jgi:hypothetical protein
LNNKLLKLKDENSDHKELDELITRSHNFEVQTLLLENITNFAVTEKERLRLLQKGYSETSTMQEFIEGRMYELDRWIKLLNSIMMGNKE